MGLAAFTAAVVTVLVGTLLLADLAPPAGLRRYVASHVVAALAAVALVAVAAFTASGAIGWAGAAVLAGAGGLGLMTWRRSGGGGSVSRGMLAAHGGLAAIALVLTVAAALRV